MRSRTFKIPTSDGVKEVELIQRFSHYIGGIQYWFAIHRFGNDPDPILSEWYSGVKISSLHFLSTGLDTLKLSHKERAKIKLDQLVVAYSAEVIRKKFDDAAKHNPLNGRLT